MGKNNNGVARTLSKKKIWVIIITFIILSLAAVAIALFIVNSYNAQPLAKVSLPKKYSFSDYDTAYEIKSQNILKQEFQSAYNDFSYNTAAQILTGQKDNVNYSPISLYYSLAMAACGANGDTEKELLTLLGTTDSAELLEQCGKLYRRIFKDNSIGKLIIKNSLWMDNDIKWKEDYVKRMADEIYAYSFSEPFSEKKTAKLMAEWISGNTKGTIKPDIKIDSQQIFSIINTIYFYDQWSNDFSKKETESDIFYLDEGGTINCDFMNKKEQSFFRKGENFTAAAIGMKNGGKMIFVLPDEGTSVQNLIGTKDLLQNVFEGGSDGYGAVTWQIPKFEFGTMLNLVGALKNLGINTAFGDNADFSGITDSKAFISTILQQTYIGIDEKGVEASAYTSIQYSSSAEPSGSAEMILNRPFIYGITVDNRTMLFVGICNNPSLT